MKKHLALLLSLCMLLALVACGGGSEAADDPNLGLYEAATAEMWGIEIEVGDLYENGFTLELKAKGKCTINADGTKANGKWTLDGDQIHLSAGGVEIDGILSDGTIAVEDLMGMGVNMVFVNAAYGAPVASRADLASIRQ